MKLRMRVFGRVAQLNHQFVIIAVLVPVFVISGLTSMAFKKQTQAATAVPGESYQICGAQSAQYLTSPWTYSSLGSGSQTYTVAQYEALSGYGTSLPPLPGYISGEGSSTEAAVIFAPGSSVSVPQYDFPNSPLLYFFEGGAYGELALQSVSGDEFIGGSASGFPEPTFDDGDDAAGISAQNDSFDAPSNTTAISHVTTAASQGTSTVSLAASSLPLVQWGVIKIGSSDYTISSITGSQSGGYTVTIQGGLDSAAAANAPVYYDGLSGGVTVKYLDISHDEHITTGTIYTGAGWTIEDNNIHDGFSSPGLGVAIYGGDEGTIEYNCLSKMGVYGINVFGTNNKFDYNEVFESNYEPDPGCGCSGGGKWWGTLNADIVGNAFIDDSPGGTFPVWLDNGNSGTLIADNYFEKSVASAISSETGFNLDITNNLFEDDNWGTGNGPGNTNSVGAVSLNSSGGFHVPGSRYDNSITISGNQFINSWGGVSIWQSGGRSCENSGEGWPEDAAYCSGGFPNTASAAAGGQYYFSHYGSSTNGESNTVAQAASAGSTSILVKAAQAINDQVGFADAAKTTTTSTTNVTSLSNSTINVASTASFPSSGQLRVGTSAAWSDGNGSWTGAILSYTGKTGTSFTGVSIVRGSGTLSGPVWQVQPYKVTSETCYANDCKLNISPALTSAISAGDNVTNAGTCQLFATSAATPTSPLAPDGDSYWNGCQWGTANVSVTGNSFSVDPTYINSNTALSGGTTDCSTANYCGTNFMAYQEAGEAPFDDFTGGNAMVSRTSLTGCPVWDSGCTSNPLKNLNALANPPSATAHNNEPAENDTWSNNNYYGPWGWYTYWYGTCSSLPTDTTTAKSLPPSPDACNNLDFAHWQSDWQQDSTSSYSATPNSNPPLPSAKVGDFNDDGSVNLTDLSVLLTAWGTNNSTVLNNLNQSGTVNLTCLSIFLSHWGT